MTLIETNHDAMSHSEAQTLDCWRKHHFQYVEGLRPKKTTEPLRAGSVFDVFLNHWYAGQNRADRFENAMRFMGARFAEEAARFVDTGGDAATLENEITTLVGMAYHYVDTWGYETFDNVEPQLKLDTALRTGTGRASTKYRTKGFIDMVVEDDGRVVLWENKTTKSINDGYKDSFNRNRQLLWYAYALREMGRRPDSIVVNVAARAIPKWPSKVVKGDRFASIIKKDGSPAIKTTEQVLRAAITDAGFNAEDYQFELGALRDQTDTWFWRREYALTDELLDAAGAEWLALSKLRHTLPPVAMPNAVKCAMCAFKQICDAPSLESVADIVAADYTREAYTPEPFTTDDDPFI